MSLINFFKMESGHMAQPVPEEKVDKTYKRLRIQTFLAATFGYALYYVCRLSMGVMKQPLIDAGLLNATQLGIIGACLYWAYAVGKFVNGFLADSANIKRFMAAGLVVSAAMNFIMGVLGVQALNGSIANSALFILFAVCWAVNGWAQSMGAPPAIISLSRWFPLRIRGTFYGFFSSSHNIGEGLSFVFVSALVAAMGWHWGFSAPPWLACWECLSLSSSCTTPPKARAFRPLRNSPARTGIKRFLRPKNAHRRARCRLRSSVTQGFGFLQRPVPSCT